jgi:hypothetical protein
MHICIYVCKYYVHDAYIQYFVYILQYCDISLIQFSILAIEFNAGCLSQLIFKLNLLRTFADRFLIDVFTKAKNCLCLITKMSSLIACLCCGHHLSAKVDSSWVMVLTLKLRTWRCGKRGSAECLTEFH